MTALVIGLLVGVMMPTSAVARRSAPTGIHTEITAAAHAVSKISRSRFVRGQRPPLLSAVRAAQRLSGRRRPPLCRTAAAADEAISRLGLSSTWRQGRVPRSVRTPLRLLNRAESALLRRAGRRCAAPQRQTVRIAPQQ
nr:hypothetical protein [Actinomycetota bacterium]